MNLNHRTRHLRSSCRSVAPRVRIGRGPLPGLVAGAAALGVLILGGCVGFTVHAGSHRPAPVAQRRDAVAAGPKLTSFTDSLPVEDVSWNMIAVPAGTVTIRDKNGSKREVSVGPFWMSETEVIWELYDIFVYYPDNGGTEVDATSFPSKPYLPPDRGYGYEGYAAISHTHHAAERFCEWLSEMTGRHYRLPTEAEWEYAARAGATTSFACGDLADDLGEYAWFAANAEDTPHPVGQKKPNAWGLYDVHGNVAEWGWMMDGREVALGGSYLDSSEGLVFSARLFQDRTWNETDPQIPKSTWWLSDCGWVGIRLVCDPLGADK